jgi:uncharacterized coiled-coil protein SlyX
MTDEISQRLKKIEAHVAHLEREVEQLNEALIEQGGLVEQLKRQSRRQSAALEAIELEHIKATNPKPPHYQ